MRINGRPAAADTGAVHPPRRTVSAEFTAEMVTAMWRSRERGEPFACLSCGETLIALSVAERSYRLTCIACGSQTRWFFLVRGRLHLEG